MEPKGPTKNIALDALNHFISKYTPARSKDEAEYFFSTDEISNAVADHTGKRLKAEEVYELMTDMGYTSDFIAGLEFQWLLKRE